MTVRSLVVLPAVAALLVAGPAAAARKDTIDVTAKDFSFTLSPKTVHAGQVTFVLRNDGQASHDFAIDGHTSKVIAHGKTTRLTVTLKAGKYPYKCTVDSHAELGMKGVLDVK
ncbi:MAG TPA: cupredoxin domain-containing protein [Gaiellaceae bacterium]|jgi:uncharacterized cupredoxin-like copper-binding protein